MFSIRNQLICLSIAVLLLACLQPDPVHGQMKKKKAILKGLMGAGLLKTLFKSKKGVLPIPLPLPLPLPIDWHTQAGLLSKNQQPSHVSHQPYPQSGIQMSPIEYSEYQNAISQALSSGNSYNSYIPSSYGGSGASNGGSSGYSSGSGQSENSGYGSSAPSNGYDGSSGSSDDSNSNGGYGGSQSGPVSYGVAGQNQNDEYNAYQVSNNEQGGSGGYRAAAASSNYNVHYGQQQGGYGQFGGNQYAPSQYGSQYNNAPSEQYSQPAPTNEQQQPQQYQQNGYQNSPSGQSNYEDNSGSASSNSYVATSGQSQQQSTNNYIPLRSVPIYHVQANQYQANSQQTPNYASNGWVALD